MEDVLAIRDLHVNFGREGALREAVSGLELQIPPAQTVALLGESGCGKSLTALAILRILPLAARISPPSEVTFEGEPLLDYSEMHMRDIRGKRIAMIFQEPMSSLNPVMTVGAQVAEVIKQHFSYPRASIKPRVVQLFHDVGLSEPEQRYNQYPHQLSGGMKQRVMIAMALAGEPELLIADEPTTALDVTIQAQILELLQKIQRERQMAILLITHDLSVVRQVADEVAVMYAGHVVEQAPCEQLFSDPKHPYTQALLRALPDQSKRHSELHAIEGHVPALGTQLPPCRFADRCTMAWELCHHEAPKNIAVSALHNVRCHLYGDQAKPIQTMQPLPVIATAVTAVTADVLLQVRNLAVYYPIKKGILQRTVGHVKAVDGIDLTLHAGETVALVGESGCGKTTAARALLSLAPVYHGSVHYKGRDLVTSNRQQLKEFRRDVQIIFQDPVSAMNPRMLVRDIIAEGLENLTSLSTNAIEQRIDTLLQQVGLPMAAKWQYPHEFSGGQKQRICIARALAINPKVIICDEPTSALDVSVQAQIINLLRKLQAEFGLTYLFITHNISVVSYLADTVAVMYLGRIVEQGPALSVLQNPKHPYTQALLASVPSISARQPLQYLHGEQPSSSAPPSGCYFHPRCSKATPNCKVHYPDMVQLDPYHKVACELYQLDRVS